MKFKKGDIVYSSFYRTKYDEPLLVIKLGHNGNCIVRPPDRDSFSLSVDWMERTPEESMKKHIEDQLSKYYLNMIRWGANQYEKQKDI